jgi:hypothetical protein
MPTHTYKLKCPEPSCADEFTVEIDPTAEGPDGLLDGQGELITCEACGEEWEWHYVPETDTLTLLLTDADEDDEDEADKDDEEEDDAD